MRGECQGLVKDPATSRPDLRVLKSSPKARHFFLTFFVGVLCRTSSGRYSLGHYRCFNQESRI